MGKPSRGSILRGDRGQEVKDLQIALNEAGADPALKVDGIFGPLTEKALRQFQTDNDYVVNGYVEPALAIRMGLQEGTSTEADAKVGPDAEVDADIVSSGAAAREKANIDTTFGDSDAAVVAGKQTGASDLSLPGNAGLWYNTTTKKWHVVYKVPPIKGQDEPLYVSWEIADDADLEALVGAGIEAKPNWKGTSAQMQTIGVIPLGDSQELLLDDIEGDPFDTWVEDFSTEAAMRPWLLDEDWLHLSVQAMMEREDGQVTVAEMQATKWWKDHSVEERTWMETYEADPTTAQNTIRDNRTALAADLMDAGVTNVPQELINYMADQTTFGHWTTEMLMGQMTALADPFSTDVIDAGLAEEIVRVGFDPMQSREDENTVRNLVYKWLGPVHGEWSDADIASAAGRMRNDPKSGETILIESLKDQRMAAYGNYEDRNLSYASIAQPWVRAAEQTWGVPMIDETDAVFQKVVRENDAAQASIDLRKAGLERGYERPTNLMIDGLSDAMERGTRGTAVT